MKGIFDVIRVAEPALVGNERKYVLDCLDRNQLTMGYYVESLEREFAKFCGTKYALATANGTVALHLILKAIRIGPGDFVIVPNITYVATANAVTYCGATPVFADVNETWCIDPEEVGKLASALGRKAKAVLPVHLYGLPCDMTGLYDAVRGSGILIVEDAAESFGSSWHGCRTGSLGTAGMFSLYANKILIAGEGGIITTDDRDLYEHMKLLRGQGVDPSRRYWHTEVGYNYRMTDLQAAIGLGQIEMADWHIKKRQEVFAKYSEHLSETEELSFQPTRANTGHVRWMVVVVFSSEKNRDAIAEKLLENGIETRPVFPQITHFPMYREHKEFPMSENISKQGLCLPTHAKLLDDEIEFICDRLKEALG